MITVSVCMIVKNESQILARCLDSLRGIWDELIIVDTGSQDDTVTIARRYTDKVYSFEWTGDFSEARNFALDKASCDYIYSADADEILEGDNVDKFLALKRCLDPCIDVVQMYYGNQLDNGTVYNFDRELRPKLFRRLKPIRFIEPIHETLNISPVVFDSDIEITHKPTSQHGSRDIATFKRLIAEGTILSERLEHFFAREMYMQGTIQDLQECESYLNSVTVSEDRNTDEVLEACVLLTRLYRVTGKIPEMFDNAIKVVAMESCSEVCVELGQYYYDIGKYTDAAVWFYNAYHECTPILSIHSGKEDAIGGLADTYEKMGDPDTAAEYRNLLNEE